MPESSSFPFLASRETPESCRWHLIGLPYDEASSFRRGAQFGPQEIRRASDSIESYSPYQERDLEDFHFFDAGDLELTGKSPEQTISVIRTFYSATYKRGISLLGLGGDHMVTAGAVQGLVSSGVRPQVLYLDAHMDVRGEYTGGIYSHACVARRLAEQLGSDHLHVWGVRSGERSEFEWAKSENIFRGREFSALKKVLRNLDEDPVYLTIDLDVFDPAEFPGVGNPEPGGLRFTEFLDLLEDLQDMNIIGADVVELAPVWDPSGRSSVMAAEIVRELLLAVMK
jgi:agmatinase